MKKALPLATAMTAILFAAAIGKQHPAIAMTIDCSKADAMMLKAHSMVQTEPAMTGNADKDFVAMEIPVAKAQVMMAHIEMQCGTTAAIRRSAQQLLRESQERLQMFRDQGQS